MAVRGAISQTSSADFDPWDEQTRPTGRPAFVLLIGQPGVVQRLGDLLAMSELGRLRIEYKTSLVGLDDCLGDPALQCVVVEEVPGWDLAGFVHQVQLAELGYGIVLVSRDPTAARRLGAHECVSPDIDSSELLYRQIESAIQKQSLRRLQRRLYRAERLATVGELAAAVAHEVNNPAAFALANLSELRDRVDELVRTLDGARRDREQAPANANSDANAYEMAVADIYEMIDDSLEGVQRIAAVVSELRRFSRVGEVGEGAQVRLNDIVRAALRLLKSPLSSSSRLSLDLRNTPFILGRREELTKAVIGLLEDAMSSCGGPGERHVLCVRTEASESTVRLVVEDYWENTGDADSVPPPTLNEPPRDSLIQPRRLSVASETIAAHGGTLTVEHTQFGKTRRVVELVAHRTPRPAPRPEAGDATPTVKRRVLIVDDELPLLRAYKRALSRHYQVVTASSGAEALAELSGRAEYDLILCDLSMPDMSGPDLFRKIHRRHPGLAQRIVFCSGGAFSPAMQHFIEQVPNTVLKKPVPTHALIDTIEAVSLRADEG